LTNNQLCKAFGICIATLYKIRNGKEAYKWFLDSPIAAIVQGLGKW
jgi:DNA polymerase III delta subunit